MRRRRYQWTLEGPEGGQVRLQVIVLAGTAEVGLSSGAADGSGEQPWAGVPLEIIARDLAELSVQFRPQDDQGAAWSEDWEDPERPFVARIRVRVGDEMVEQVVAPAVNAPIVTGEEGES